MCHRGVFVLLITALAVCLVAPCAHALEAGATKIELVPPDDVPLDGLTLRAGRRATGIHDPLYVRALYLEEDGVAIFLVSLDLFAVSDALRQRILELTPPSVREDHVLVTATHTLRGPGGLNRSWLGRQRAGRFMPGWMESVAQAASEAMRSAYDTRVRGSMGYATGEQTGMTLNPTAPELPHDSQLGVIRVDDSDGNPIAVLANTAGAEPAPGESTLYTLSAGYPGAFCTAFEGMSPGNVVAFFLNGAAADQRWAVRSDSDTEPWTEMNRLAEAFALRAKSIANEIECRELDIALHTVSLAWPPSSAEGFRSSSMPIQILEIEGLAITFVPGVPSASVALRLREDAIRLGYRRHFTVAPANAYAGAWLDEAAFLVPSSDADSAFVGPETTARIRERIALSYSRAKAPEPRANEDVPDSHAQTSGIIEVAETGSAYRRGQIRGAVLSRASSDAWEGFSRAWIVDRSVHWNPGPWRWLRSDTAAFRLALPFVADRARPLLASAPAPTRERLYAMARATGVSATELWLKQLAPPAQDAVGIGSDRAYIARDGVSGPVFFRSVAWPAPVSPVVSRTVPDVAANHVAVSLPWQVGAVAAINRHGVAAMVLPDRTPQTLRAPAEVLTLALVEEVRSYAEAVDWLMTPRNDVGGRVLVSGTAPEELAIVLVGPDPLVMPLDADRMYIDVVPRVTPDGGAFERDLAGLDRPSADAIEGAALRAIARGTTGDGAMPSETRLCIVVNPAAGELRVLAIDGTATGSFARYTAEGLGHE